MLHWLDDLTDNLQYSISLCHNLLTWEIGISQNLWITSNEAFFQSHLPILNLKTKQKFTILNFKQFLKKFLTTEKNFQELEKTKFTKCNSNEKPNVNSSTAHHFPNLIHFQRELTKLLPVPIKIVDKKNFNKAHKKLSKE